MKMRIVRMYGYKSSHGVDANMINCSVSNLFCPNSEEYLFYSSRKTYNVNCTGVVISERDESEQLFVEYNKFFSQMSIK